MKLPAGIVVPSENVKSFIVLRAIVTANCHIFKVDSEKELRAVMPTLTGHRLPCRTAMRKWEMSLKKYLSFYWHS
jgi:hypothetical protein